MIASIGNDPGSIAAFVVTVFVFFVACAAALTGGGMLLRDASGWAARSGGAVLVATGVACWFIAAVVGLFGGYAAFDVWADRREQVRDAHRSCEASTPGIFQKAEIEQCVDEYLE